MKQSNYRQAFNYIEKTTGFSFMNLLPVLNPYSRDYFRKILEG